MRPCVSFERMTEHEAVDLESQLKSLSLNKFNSVSDKGSECYNCSTILNHF